MILFKKKFKDAIRTGRKIQTIRLWRHQMVRPREVHRVPGTGYVRVTGVAEVELDRLTDEDSRADGFASLDELRAEISRIYGDGSPQGRRFFRIQFEYLGEDRPPHG